MTDSIIFDRDEIDLVVSFAGCSLDRSPGSNWVQSAGGLPEYICRIARAIHRGGTPVDRAIAIAVSRVKKWAAGADDVDADTRAKAAKAVAEWEALKAKSKVKKAVKNATSRGGGRDRDTVRASHPDTGFICLARTDYNVDTVRTAFEAHNRTARSAWRAANPGANYDDGPPYLYIKELWTSFVIVNSEGYRGDGKLYKIPYTVDAEHNVTFGDATEVKTQYVAVPAADAPGADISDITLTRLVEISDRANPTAVQQILALSRGGAGDLDTILRLKA